MMLEMATMARPWLRLWLFLQLPGFCTNLLSPRTPGHIFAQTNKSTQIVCLMKREHTGIYWYRWNQGRQHFEFLLFSSPLGKPTYGTNINQEKFSIRGTSSHHPYSLNISQLHGSDNGTYYCCTIQSSQLILGTGTQLSVVDVLPLPSMSTLVPLTKKPTRCKPKSKAFKKGACSPLVWVPLAATVLLLLLSVIPTCRCFYRLRRRLWLRAHRK